KPSLSRRRPQEATETRKIVVKFGAYAAAQTQFALSFCVRVSLMFTSGGAEHGVYGNHPYQGLLAVSEARRSPQIGPAMQATKAAMKSAAKRLVATLALATVALVGSAFAGTGYPVSGKWTYDGASEPGPAPKCNGPRYMKFDGATRHDTGGGIADF